MPRFNVVDYDKVGRKNLERTLARRSIHKKILKRVSSDGFADSLRAAMEECCKGSVILLESPAESYFKVNMESVKSLLDSGYKGVYMSFQRPFSNLVSMFKEYDIDVDKLLVVDGATFLCGGVLEKDPRCVGVSENMSFGDLIEVVYNSLPRLKGEKRFVFVDSLSTMSLYESMSEVSRFCNDLISVAKNRQCEEVTFLFNVAGDLADKRYVEDIAGYADHYLHLGLCT